MSSSKMLRSVAVFAALTAGAVGMAGTGTAQAGTVSTCPTVASGSGTVTPAPTPGADWSGCDLSGAYFHNADLTDVNLSGANLSGADLTGATAHGTDFSGANLSGANAFGAQIVAANLRNADLEYFEVSYITDSDLTGADISQANLSSAVLTGVRSGGLTDPGGAPLLPADWHLDNGYLIGPGVDFSGVSFPALGQNAPSLSETNLADSRFSSANMTGVDLKDDNLTDGQFAGTNLTGADLYGVNLAGSYLQGATLAGNIMTGVESGGITGTPAKLPAHWSLRHGYLLGPDAGLVSANLAGVNLTGVDMAGANLYLGTVAGANLTGVNFKGAYLDGTDLTGAKWSNTICPDGTNSDNDHGTCANNIDDQPPVANPVVSGPEKNGWYTKATVTWNWTDANASIDPAKCVTTTTSATEGAPATLTATCSNTLGAVSTAAVSVDIENKAPVVIVTGVAAGHVYAAGHVPAAGCRTADSLSGVAKNAAVTVTTSGTHGVGSFTATCAGAVNNAGIGQAAPVRVKYAVAYGLSKFSTPKNKTTVPRSSHAVTVTFKLSGSTAAMAAKLAAAGDIRVSLTGPGISPVTVTAAWQPKSGTFSATLHIPSKVKTNKAYLITVRENVGTGLVAAPPLGTALNPETIRFS